jgi:hypothetical protein
MSEETIYSNVQAKDCGGCTWGGNNTGTDWDPPGTYGVYPCVCGSCEPPLYSPTHPYEVAFTPCV